MENAKNQIDGNKPEYKPKCERCAKDHIPLDLVNFNFRKMYEFCHRIAETYFYELKVLPGQQDVCHFIPREPYGVVPIQFSVNPED
jgi:hypothetical protein